MFALRWQNDVSDSCRIHQFSLAFVWCLSLLSGVFFSYVSQDFITSLMRTVPMCRMSIVGQGLILLLPLLLSAILVLMSVPGLIYIIVYIDGIAFGYCLLGAILAFGSAGWLVFFLISFSKIVLVVPKLCFFMKCITERCAHRTLFICLIIAVPLICCYDYFFISQFLIHRMF